MSSNATTPPEDGWTLTYDEATPLHIGPCEVIVNGERYVREATLFAAIEIADLLRETLALIAGITESPVEEVVRVQLRNAKRVAKAAVDA